MATINLGRIKPVFRGAYAGGTAYVIDDIVTFGDETFICILASTGNATSNATYWTKLAAKGAAGAAGAEGGTTTLTTQGDVLYQNASGVARLAAGTSGQFLKTQGAGANPTWGSAGGNTALLGDTTVSSAVSSVDFTNIFDDATYGYYKIMVDGMQRMFVTGGGSDGQWCSPYMYYTDASGSNITLSPALNMRIRMKRDYSGLNGTFDSVDGDSYSYMKLLNAVHNGSDDGTGVFMNATLFNPNSTTLYKTLFYESCTQKSVSLDDSALFYFAGTNTFDCSTAIKGVKFTDALATYIRGGRFRIWGIKH